MIIQEPKQYDPGTAGFAVVPGHIAGNANHIDVINLATGVSQVANVAITAGSYSSQSSANSYSSLAAVGESAFYIYNHDSGSNFNLTKLSIANFSTVSNNSGASIRYNCIVAPSRAGSLLIAGGYSGAADTTPVSALWNVNTSSDAISSLSASLNAEQGYPSAISSPGFVTLVGGAQGSSLVGAIFRYISSLDSVSNVAYDFSPTNRQNQSVFSTGVGSAGSFGYLIGGNTSKGSGTSTFRSRINQPGGSLEVLATVTGLSSFANGFSANNSQSGLTVVNGGAAVNIYSFSTGVYTASGSSVTNNRQLSLGSNSSISPVYQYFKLPQSGDGTLLNEAGRVINSGGSTTFGANTANTNHSELNLATQVRTAVTSLGSFIDSSEFSGRTNTYITGGSPGGTWIPVTTTYKFNYITGQLQTISAVLTTALGISSSASNGSEAHLLYGVTDQNSAATATNYRQKFNLATEVFSSSSTVAGGGSYFRVAKLQDYDKALFIGGLNSSSSNITAVDTWSYSTDAIYTTNTLGSNIGAGSRIVASPSAGYLRFSSTHLKIRSTPYTDSTMSQVITASDQYSVGSGQSYGTAIGGNVSSASTAVVTNLYFATDSSVSGTSLLAASIYSTAFSTVASHLRLSYANSYQIDSNQAGNSLITDGVTTDNSSTTSTRSTDFYRRSDGTMQLVGTNTSRTVGYIGSGVCSGTKAVTITGITSGGSTSANFTTWLLPTMTVVHGASLISRNSVGTYSSPGFGLFVGGSGSSAATEVFNFTNNSLFTGPGTLNTYISQTFMAGTDTKVHKVGGLHASETTISEVLSLTTMGWTSTASLNLASARRGYAAQAGFGSAFRSHHVGGYNGSALVSTSTVAPFSTDTTASGPSILGGNFGAYSTGSNRQAAQLFGGVTAANGSGLSSVINHNFSRETTDNLTVNLSVGKSQSTAVSTVFPWITVETQNQQPGQSSFSHFIFLHCGSTNAVEGSTVIATAQVFNTVSKTQNTNVSIGSGKRENTCTTNKTSILSVSGYDGTSSYVTSKHLISVANRSWAANSAAAMTVTDARGYIGSATYGNDAFISSGFNGSGIVNDVQIYQFLTNVFTSAGAQTTARANTCAIPTSLALYTVSGGTAPGGVNITNVIGKLTLQTLAHTNLGVSVATARSSSTAFTNGSIGLHVGGTTSAGTASTVVEQLNSVTETISAATALVAARTYSRGVCSDSSTGYILGGASASTPLNTVIEYNLSNGSNSVTSPTITSAVAGAGACSTNPSYF